MTPGEAQLLALGKKSGGPPLLQGLASPSAFAACLAAIVCCRSSYPSYLALCGAFKAGSSTRQLLASVFAGLTGLLCGPA